MSKKRKRKESKKKHVTKEQIFDSCFHGGYQLDDMKRFIDKYQFSMEDLEYAIEILTKTVSSGLEAGIANNSIIFIKQIIKDKKNY